MMSEFINNNITIFQGGTQMADCKAAFTKYPEEKQLPYHVIHDHVIGLEAAGEKMHPFFPSTESSSVTGVSGCPSTSF